MARIFGSRVTWWGPGAEGIRLDHEHPDHEVHSDRRIHRYEWKDIRKQILTDSKISKQITHD